jgi:hypothetical protein
LTGSKKPHPTGGRKKHGAFISIADWVYLLKGSPLRLDRRVDWSAGAHGVSQLSESQNQDAAKVLLAEAGQKAIPPTPASVIEQAESFIEASNDRRVALKDFEIHYNSGLVILENVTSANVDFHPQP